MCARRRWRWRTARISASPARRIAFKLELLQHAGSFKARGAFANLLTRDVPPAGVVAASGGNHGAAVAYRGEDARRAGARSSCPSVASPAKIARIRELRRGAGGRRASAMPMRWPRARTGWRDIGRAAGPRLRPARDPARPGHGRRARFEEQAPELDTLLVAVGGGGLIGGIAAWYRRPVRDRRRRAGSGADAARGAAKPGGRSMRRPAASPRIRWRRSGSAR